MMKGGCMIIELVFSIISILSLVFCILVMTDMIIFLQKVKEIKTGMTGKEIQRITGLKLKIIRIESNVYYAQIISHFTMFKYRLVFCNGKLISKQRD